MSGPPPVPTNLRVLRGNPSKRPLRAQPTQTSAPPEAPSYLVSYACDEWHRVAPELHRLGLLTLLDVHALAAYCQSYARWRTAEELLAKMAERDPTTRALLIKDATGNPRQNPLVRTAAHAAGDMLRYAGEFGLTPVARARLAAGPFGQPPGGGKFDGLLA